MRWLIPIRLIGSINRLHSLYSPDFRVCGCWVWFVTQGIEQQLPLEEESVSQLKLADVIRHDSLKLAAQGLQPGTLVAVALDSFETVPHFSF